MALDDTVVFETVSCDLFNFHHYNCSKINKTVLCDTGTSQTGSLCGRKHIIFFSSCMYSSLNICPVPPEGTFIGCLGGWNSDKDELI